MAENVAAIILAGGLSTRMGEFKPLLPLGGKTLLERSVALFREAGIDDVRVVTGHRAAELEPMLSRLGVRSVANQNFREGMFTSVAAGMATIGSDLDAFFVLPVDIPLVRPATIRRLLDAFLPGDADIIHPRFRGVRGHPPLIAASLAGELARWNGEDGLRGALAMLEERSIDLDVADGNVLLDIDSPDDYRLLLERAYRPELPCRDECLALLKDVLHLEEGIISHGKAVAELATMLGKELNRAGCRLDIPLLAAAGLLHDIAKGEPDHARAGATLLREHGFDAVAGPVATHMDIPGSLGAEISASEVIYLADKMVRGDRLVSLKERFVAKMERHGDDPAIIAVIKTRLERAQAVRDRIETRLGKRLDELLSHPTHPENFILPFQK